MRVALVSLALVLLAASTLAGKKKKFNEACLLPKVIGPCRSAFRRFYYDVETATCKPFKYGGCHGNENNFKKMKQCKKNCGHAYPKACLLPKVVGKCKAAFPRFYFDVKSASCQQFIFGGCDGNENNFESEAACRCKCQPNTKGCKNGKPKATTKQSAEKKIKG